MKAKLEHAAGPVTAMQATNRGELAQIEGGHGGYGYRRYGGYPGFGGYGGYSPGNVPKLAHEPLHQPSRPT